MARTIILGRCGELQVGRKGGKFFIDVPGEKRSYKKKSLVEAHFRRGCKRLRKSPFILSGPDGNLQCRDGSGAFVPVAQCKGPVGHDKAGRFKSLK